MGIGTTSPSQKLTIGNGGKIALVRASPATNTGFVYTDSNGTILESDTTNSDPVILTSPGTGGTIRISTAGTERARITSGGDLLIGTTTANPAENNVAGSQFMRMDLFNGTITNTAVTSYVGALKYIEVDTEISNYYLNSIKNGFTAQTHIQLFKGIPTPESNLKTKTPLGE